MINIVTLTRNRGKLVQQFLKSLYATLSHKEFTLTIVDDESDEASTDRILRNSPASNMTRIRVENSTHNLAMLKNLGVQASRLRWGQGDWLYLGDSDTMFLPDWAREMKDLAVGTETSGFQLWGGQVHPYHQPKAVQPGPQWLSEVGMLDGPSWLMRWATWDKVGGLEGTAPGPGQSEDTQFCNKITSAGGRIGVTVPHVVLHTGLTNTLGKDIPGRELLQDRIPKGVLAE